MLKHSLKLASFFPKHHAIAAACMAVVMIVGVISPVSSSITRTSQSLALPAHTESQDLPELNDTNVNEVVYTSITVQPGDSLSVLFDRAGLPSNDMYALLNSGKEGQALADLKPHESFSYRLEDGHITEFVRHSSRLKRIHFWLKDSGVDVEHIEMIPERRLTFKAMQLQGNLFNSAIAAGAPQAIIMEMASIFGGVMDFVYDPREGDTFSVLYEELYLEGEMIGTGHVVATQYTNQGKAYEAFRYENAKGDIGYYDANGISMRKAFLRAPVDFTRISSSFNPNRLHPVLKTKRPHRGIDYAAATGTPVYAAGNGRVVQATYNKPSGNFVVIQHGPRYQTKYLHLNKRKVKVGQRVSQGQVIGTVGSTGWATGPHLHYEFLLDGVHRNPRTILKKLPKAEHINKTELARFRQQVQPIEQQFAAYQRLAPVLIAKNRSQNNKQG